MFDARVFNIPKEEVTNYFYWRQLDCSRNSIQMVGQANQKFGSCVIKEDYFQSCEDGKFIKFPDGCSDPYEDEESETGVWRSRWIIDKDIPIFRDEGRQYIERFVNVGDE